MSKFSKGDKVVTSSGERGVIDWVYDDEVYAVLRDGAKMPDKIEGYKLKAANGITSTNAVVQKALNAERAVCNDNPKYSMLERELLSAIRRADGAKIKSLDSKIRGMGCEWVAQKKSGLLADNVSWIIEDAKDFNSDPYTGIRITEKGKMWNAENGVAKNAKMEWGEAVDIAQPSILDAKKSLNKACRAYIDYVYTYLKAASPDPHLAVGKKRLAVIQRAISDLASIS